jgi:hypothetical protein
MPEPTWSWHATPEPPLRAGAAARAFAMAWRLVDVDRGDDATDDEAERVNQLLIDFFGPVA